MRLQRLVFTCAVSGLLVFASASYAADAPAGAAANATPEAAANPAPVAAANAPAEVAANPPAEAATNPSAEATNPRTTTNGPPTSTSQKTLAGTAAANNPPTVNNPERIYLIRENPFFGLHIEKAVQHARDAEMAGNLGQSAELMEHAQMALSRAREAQRAGNVPGLNEGIANLRKALNLNTWLASTQASPSSAEGTDPRCIDELQRECGDVQPGSGRIQKCFDDKIDNFSPMCQETEK